MSRRISKPLKVAAAELQRVATGDLTVALDVRSHDEVGTVGRAINDAVKAMRAALNEVAETAGVLGGTSHGLASVASQMSAISQQTSSQAVEVAASSNQVSGNLQTMAAAAEEMGASIQDISRNASHASDIAIDAAGKARFTVPAGTFPNTQTGGTADFLAFLRVLIIVLPVNALQKDVGIREDHHGLFRDH